MTTSREDLPTGVGTVANAALFVPGPGPAGRAVTGAAVTGRPGQGTPRPARRVCPEISRASRQPGGHGRDGRCPAVRGPLAGAGPGHRLRGGRQYCQPGRRGAGDGCGGLAGAGR